MYIVYWVIFALVLLVWLVGGNNSILPECIIFNYREVNHITL